MVGSISEALAETGEFNKAIDLAHQTVYGREKAFAGICRLLVCAGEIEMATHLANQISSLLYRECALGDILQDQMPSVLEMLSRY